MSLVLFELGFHFALTNSARGRVVIGPVLVGVTCTIGFLHRIKVTIFRNM